MFIGQCAAQRAEAGVHLGAQFERARARARVSAGQTPCAGKRSCRYSAMASVSHTAKPSSTSTGTQAGRADRGHRAPERRVGVEVEAQLRSSNGCPARVISTQGRIDHDE
jgi:hypothetical protein